jgi:hypothetical protein
MVNYQMNEGIRYIRYTGKGQKVYKLPVHPTAGYYVDEYVKWMEKIGRKISDEDF